MANCSARQKPYITCFLSIGGIKAEANKSLTGGCKNLGVIRDKALGESRKICALSQLASWR